MRTWKKVTPPKDEEEHYYSLSLNDVIKEIALVFPEDSTSGFYECQLHYEGMIVNYTMKQANNVEDAMKLAEELALETFEALKRAADNITTQLRTGTLNSDENGTYEQESN